MTEEKREKKKLGIVRRIFKWIGLGLLAVLIILGLIFQAPWKVIALLLIILAACTQLPRPARKWFWLSAAAVIIALIIWVFLPDDNEGWRPYTFDEELAALEAARSIPDSENAATIYNQLLDNYDANTFEPNFMDDDLDVLTRREPWSSKDHPEIAEWLKGQQSTIAKLLEASKLEKCRFPIPSDTFSLGESMERLPAMRRWARLLIRAANNDLGDGRVEQALEKYIAVLQMGKHERQQPTMIDFLVGIAIEALSTKQLKNFIVTANPTEEHLTLIEEALSETKHDWASNLPNFLEHDKLMAKSLLSMAYEINPKGKVRMSRDPFAAMRVEFPEELPPLTYWQRKLAKAGTVLGWFVMPSTPQKAGEIIDNAFERHYAMAEPDFDWEQGPSEQPKWPKFNFGFVVKLLADLLEEPYYKIHDLYLRTIAEQRGARLIIALRRYKNKTGRWPENLDEVKPLVDAETFVDPFNNGSFVYKLTDDSFKLYSKGKNNVDENGKRKDGADDWLIWPPRSRKTQEENADAEQQ